MIVCGRPYRINTDFRFGLEYNRLMLSGKVMEKEVLDLWFPERQPEQFEPAHEAIKRFYSCGIEQTEKNVTAGPVPYGFDTDSGALVAAFQREYHIDLTCETLHWWRFFALLSGLTSHSFSERVQYRMCDLQEIKSKDLRQRYARMKRKYALDSYGKAIKEPQTAEEYDSMLLRQAKGGG